jgi:Plasma-membrane choline transporter
MDDASRKETSKDLMEPLLCYPPLFDNDSRIVSVEMDEEDVVASQDTNVDTLGKNDFEGGENPFIISRHHHYHHLQHQEQQQENSKASFCRDPIWAVIFVLQIVVLMSLGFTWGLQSMATNDPSSSSSWIPHSSKLISDFTILLAAIFVLASLLSSVALMIMARWAEKLIQGSIIFNIMMTLLLSILCAVQHQMTGSLIFLFVALMGVCYARSVWSMIPWAASNLSTAVAAISQNLGIYLVGLGTSLMAVLYSIVWLMAVMGTEWRTTSCAKDGACDHHGSGFILALFSMSLFWTLQVLKVR